MLVIHIFLLASLSFAADPFVFYNFEVSYITASPLGVSQQVCSPDLSMALYFLLCFTLTVTSFLNFLLNFYVGLLSSHG